MLYLVLNNIPKDGKSSKFHSLVRYKSFWTWLTKVGIIFTTEKKLPGLKSHGGENLLDSENNKNNAMELIRYLIIIVVTKTLPCVRKLNQRVGMQVKGSKPLFSLSPSPQMTKPLTFCYRRKKKMSPQKVWSKKVAKKDAALVDNDLT